MNPRAVSQWALAAAAFAAPLSIAGVNAALGVLTVSLAASWSSDPGLRAALRDALRSPVFKLLAAGAVWALVCAAAGLDSSRGLRAWPKELHRLWAFLALGAALGSVPRAKTRAGLAAGLVAAALVGLGQTVFLSGGEAGFVRARGFVHAVVYGEMIGLGLIGAAACLGLAALAPGARRASAAGALLLLAALAANQTRAVLLASAAAATAAALEVPRLRRGLLAALVSLVALGVAWEFAPTGGRNLRTLLSDSPEASAHRARLVLWDAALAMARERPVTGVGPGSFRRAFEETGAQGALDGERVWGSAHNLFLHQLAERGFPGLGLLLALFWAFYAGARRAWLERRDAAALWSLAATAAFVVMNLTETAWQTEQAATFFLLSWLWGAGPRA
ncbi:MAG: O-antigen ligase family protein [Elusimicrobiota bacterium]|nr:O-antigen ligase family protein [Elusimicrobiota bacterium]